VGRARVRSRWRRRRRILGRNAWRRILGRNACEWIPGWNAWQRIPGWNGSAWLRILGWNSDAWKPGEGEHSWGHGWDHDHDGDHDHHHHHDHDGGFYFLDNPYFDYGDADVDYIAVPGDDGYWYYCYDSNSYFPYVKECASEWERVTPYQ
jgi:hypothetical protein